MLQYISAEFITAEIEIYYINISSLKLKTKTRSGFGNAHHLLFPDKICMRYAHPPLYQSSAYFYPIKAGNNKKQHSF